MAEQGDSKSGKNKAANAKSAGAKSKAAKVSSPGTQSVTGKKGRSTRSTAGSKKRAESPAATNKSASATVTSKSDSATGTVVAASRASEKSDRKNSATLKAEISSTGLAVDSDQKQPELEDAAEPVKADPPEVTSLAENLSGNMNESVEQIAVSAEKNGGVSEAKSSPADPDTKISFINPEAASEKTSTREPQGPRTAPTRQEIFKAWWKAARPPFYIATLVPLFLGYFAARNDVWNPSLLVFTGVLLVGFILHLCANLANDLFDYLLETDTQETIGGSRGLQDGTITVRQLRIALACCYGLAALFTVIGVWITGLWGLLLVALFGALASYYYVAPPIMYGYRALGEVLVFISMGIFMVGGSYYALAGELQPYVLALSFPVGLGVAGILYYQSLPEIETDAAAGKRTLAGLLGPEKAVFLFKLWWPAIWFLLITLYLAGLAAWPVLLGVLFGLPFYLKACQRLSEFGGDWFSLDKYGKYVRAMYMLMGIFLLIGVAQV